jgi:hypothetical protein
MLGPKVIQLYLRGGLEVPLFHTHTNINWKGGEIQKAEREGLEWEQSFILIFF